MKRAIWTYRVLRGRRNIIKLVLWAILIFILLVLYRFLLVR